MKDPADICEWVLFIIVVVHGPSYQIAYDFLQGEIWGGLEYHLIQLLLTM